MVKTREWHGTTVDSFLITAGGIRTEGQVGEYSNQIEVFDCNGPSSVLDPMGDSRIISAVTTLGSVVFMGFGESKLPGMNSTDSGTIDIVDTTQIPFAVRSVQRPNPRDHVCATSVGEKVFFAGGVTGLHTWPYNYQMSDVVDIFVGDGDQDIWQVQRLPGGPRSHIRCVSAGRIAMFVGGYTVLEPDYVVTDRVDYWIENAEMVSWGSARMSVARENFGIAAIGNLILFAGGVDNDNRPSVMIDIFDTTTEVWTTAALSDAREFHPDIGNVYSVNDQAVMALGGFVAGADLDLIDIFDRAVIENYINAAATNETYTAVDDLADFTQGQTGLLFQALSDLNITMYDQLNGVISETEQEIGYLYDTIGGVTDSVTAVNNSMNSQFSDIIDQLNGIISETEQEIGFVYDDVNSVNDTVNAILATLAKINPACLKAPTLQAGAGESICGGGNNNNPASSGDKTGTIVAAVLGGLFGVGITAVACIYVNRKKKKQDTLLDDHMVSLRAPLNPTSTNSSLQDL
jgi:hypothetical protein